ncbi:unnamed protein product [Darwinula stevensoni]|uniref:RING-type domain-containing protein n=1 Tax=Darwinula stevensoni TaxID=69355 RepID=A0A7R9AA07_9CRUS|nr:unnamed protein product [Darwinula stevensoni]CAG0897795.1 unnamed protein product [Darwinula stevensoni]
MSQRKEGAVDTCDLCRTCQPCDNKKDLVLVELTNRLFVRDDRTWFESLRATRGIAMGASASGSWMHNPPRVVMSSNASGSYIQTRGGVIMSSSPSGSFIQTPGGVIVSSTPAGSWMQTPSGVVVSASDLGSYVRTPSGVVVSSSPFGSCICKPSRVMMSATRHGCFGQNGADVGTKKECFERGGFPSWKIFRVGAEAGSQVDAPAEDDGDKCIICFAPYDLLHPMVALPCGHFYGLPCIHDWMARKQECPLCKRRAVFPDIVVEAVKGLKARRRKTKDLLAEDEGKIFLQIGSFRYPKKLETIRINLPYPYYGNGSWPEVCLFVRDLKKKARHEDDDDTILHFQKLLQAAGVGNLISKIIPYHQLRVEYGHVRLKEALCSQFDVFLADGSIAHRIPSLLGKTFFKRKKLPVSVKLERGKLEKVLKGAIQGIQLPILSFRADSFLTQVGKLNQTNEELVENILSVIGGLRERFPGGWHNVRNLYIKSDSMNVSIPIYISLGSRNKVEVPDVKEEEVEPVVGEVGHKVVAIYPDGQVQVIRSKDEDDDEESDEEDPKKKSRRKNLGKESQLVLNRKGIPMKKHKLSKAKERKSPSHEGTSAFITESVVDKDEDQKMGIEEKGGKMSPLSSYSTRGDSLNIGSLQNRKKRKLGSQISANKGIKLGDLDDISLSQEAKETLPYVNGVAARKVEKRKKKNAWNTWEVTPKQSTEIKVEGKRSLDEVSPQMHSSLVESPLLATKAEQVPKKGKKKVEIPSLEKAVKEVKEVEHENHLEVLRQSSIGRRHFKGVQIPIQKKKMKKPGKGLHASFSVLDTISPSTKGILKATSLPQSTEAKRVHFSPKVRVKRLMK